MQKIDTATYKTSVRFDLLKDWHKQAYEKLLNQRNGLSINEYLINAVLEYETEHGSHVMPMPVDIPALRQMIREEIRDIMNTKLAQSQDMEVEADAEQSMEPEELCDAADEATEFDDMDGAEPFPEGELDFSGEIADFLQSIGGST